MIIIRKFYDTAAGDQGGGGGDAGPSLAEIMGQAPPAPQEGVEADGITLKAGFVRNSMSGKVEKDLAYKEPNPGMKPADQQQQSSQQSQQQSQQTDQRTYVEDKDGLNKDGTLKEGFLREDGTDKIYKDPAFKAPPEGVDKDGKVLPGYMKDDKGNVVKDPNYTTAAKAAGEEQDDDPNDETGEKFIGAVEAITGRKYDIKYPDGVLPTTPEGMAHRENFIRERGAQDFEAYLIQKDPRGYAYLMHRDKGGTDEQFFGDQKGFQLPTVDDMKASADVQTNVYKQELLMKGIDPSSAQILVDAAVKDNTLVTKAEAAWKLLDQAQKDQLANLQKQHEENEKAYNTSLGNLTKNMVDSIKNGLNFVVPEANQPEFQQFIINSLRYDDGKFYVVQEMLPDTMKTTLEALYFQYRKGDLGQIITKKAKTQAAQSLKLKLPSSNPKPGTGAADADESKKNLPLSAIV